MLNNINFEKSLQYFSFSYVYQKTQNADNQLVSNFMCFEKYLQLYIMGHMISYFFRIKK